MEEMHRGPHPRWQVMASWWLSEVFKRSVHRESGEEGTKVWASGNTQRRRKRVSQESTVVWLGIRQGRMPPWNLGRETPSCHGGSWAGRRHLALGKLCDGPEEVCGEGPTCTFKCVCGFLPALPPFATSFPSLLLLFSAPFLRISHSFFLTPLYYHRYLWCISL